MLALAESLEEHAEELAQIESLDNGKPVGLAQFVDVGGSASGTCATSRGGRRRSRVTCCR